MVDRVGSIIEQALSFGKDSKSETEQRMQKFIITEDTHSQMEQIKAKSGVNMKDLISILVDAAYSVGDVAEYVPEDTRTRRWFVMMTPDVRHRLDELCRSAGGMSAGMMIGVIIHRVSMVPEVVNNNHIDLSDVIGRIDWRAEA